MTWRFLTPLLFVGCSGGVLVEGFEASLERGYACGADFVVLTNGPETLRLSASFRDLDGEVPEDSRLRVYTGARLIVDDGEPCDDQLETSWGGAPEFDCSYVQASGTVSADVDDDSIAVVTSGVTLAVEPGAPAACADHPDVVMSDGPLLAVPLQTVIALQAARR